MYSRKAFTLIEIAVVINIIGFLAFFMMPQVTQYLTRTKHTRELLYHEEFLRIIQQYTLDTGDSLDKIASPWAGWEWFCIKMDITQDNSVCSWMTPHTKLTQYFDTDPRAIKWKKNIKDRPWQQERIFFLVTSYNKLYTHWWYEIPGRDKTDTKLRFYQYWNFTLDFPELQVTPETGTYEPPSTWWWVNYPEYYWSWWQVPSTNFQKFDKWCWNGQATAAQNYYPKGIFSPILECSYFLD